MAGSAARFEEQREQLLARLQELVQDDPRLAALWLQGSLADGSADPLSDVDAWIAVEDDAFEEVYTERGTIVARLGRVLAFSDATTPGLRAAHCLMEGPAKLDLYFEPLSAAGNQARPAVRVLVDKTEAGTGLRLGWEPSPAAIGRSIEVTIRMTRQGAAWPVRLLHRYQWSTIAMMELDLINAQVAQLMAVQIDPALFFTNPFNVYRKLPREQQAEIDALTASALAALAGRDYTALGELHLRVFDALVREGRAACAALGIPYPQSDDADAAIRAFLVREWPRDER